MIRIAFVSPGKLPLPARKGGAVEGLTDILTTYLAERPDQYEVTVFSADETECIEHTGGVTYVRLTNEKMMDQLRRKAFGLMNRIQRQYLGNNFVRKVACHIRKNHLDYDVVVIENMPEYGIFLKPYVNGKMVLHMHNMEFNHTFKNAEQVFSVYEEIYAISDAVRAQIATIKESDKIRILYNGVSPEQFDRKLTRQERTQLRLKNGIGSEETVFAFAGRLVPEKGVRELIEAFLILRSRVQNVKLMIMGSPFFAGEKENSYVRELRHLAEKAGESILFTGYIDHSELYKWYGIADAGVIPSQWEEPFALTVIEELMCGLPIIASRCGGISEITSPQCAILVDLGQGYSERLAEAMETLCISEERRQKMSLQGKKQAKLFDTQRYCSCFESYISSLCVAEVN